MSTPCSGCGFVTAKGTEGCQAIFDDLAAKSIGDIRYGRIHRLVVDTYALQHPDRYMASAKSAAAHLMGVHVAMLMDNNPLVIHMIHKYLNGDGPAKLAKPELPASRGATTIADVAAQFGDPATYARAVRNWARTTWAAYAPVHPITRDWLEDMTT